MAFAASLIPSVATTTALEAPLPVPETIEAPQEPQQATGGIECSCVLFVKSLGFKLPRLIDAGNLDTNSRVPIKGGIISFVYENGMHHLAYVESIQPDGIHIKESNFEKCKIGERIISPNDEHIIGFWRSPDID
jgi:hypothetical protein